MTVWSYLIAHHNGEINHVEDGRKEKKKKKRGRGKVPNWTGTNDRCAAVGWMDGWTTEYEDGNEKYRVRCLDHRQVLRRDSPKEHILFDVQPP